MQFTIPNSAGFADIDEANVGSTATGYGMHFGKKCKKKRVREFNSCHTPDSGKFCSGTRGANAWKRTLRRQTEGPRATSVMKRLDSQMKNLAKDRPWVIYDHGPKQSRVSRAVTLRKRMDVAGPIAGRHAQRTFVGTWKRIFSDKPRFKGRKR